MTRPTYQDAGVDLAGAGRHVERIAPLVTRSWGPNVIGGFGGFAAGVEIPPGYESPVLMMSADGVGTKLEVARMTRRWEGVGYDLVAMCVDDLAAAGSTPIGFVDYMAVGALDAVRDTAVVASIAEACSKAGCALLGGETAEHPGVMAADALDLAGAALGVVERGEEITGENVAVGDVVIGLRSPNLRSNGFSLVRRILDDWDAEVDGTTVGELVLEPSVLYSPSVRKAMRSGRVAAAAHITGGGLPGNLGRPLPDGLRARVRTGTWTPPAVFELLRREGGLSAEVMFESFNMGIGFCLVTRATDVDAVSDLVAEHDPQPIGRIESGPGGVLLEGTTR